MNEERTNVEWEGKGLDYERYAMNILFRRMVERHGIKSVLEIPAKGEKAMPSLYSIPFGQHGCEVSLVNPEEKSKWAWEKLGYPVTYHEFDPVEKTDFDDGSFDLVWNFMSLSQYDRKDALVEEMKRVSRKYILFIAVNRFNPGFFSHRTVHKINDIPWNHGDIAFMNPFKTRKYFEGHGLKIIKTGLVDTPPYPDSLGFRDMRLHRKNVDLNKIDWDSRTLDWMISGNYPPKLKFLYFFEWLPLPFLLKMIYAHLFYIIAEK